MTEKYWLVGSLMIVVPLVAWLLLYCAYIAHWWPFALPTGFGLS